MALISDAKSSTSPRLAQYNGLTPSRSRASSSRRFGASQMRKREHAAEPVNAIVTPLLVGVDDGLGVGPRTVAVPALLEIAPDCGVVVDLPVVDDPDRAVFVRERLLAGAQVDDAQTPVGEDGVGVAVQADLVRSPMRKDVTHRHGSVVGRRVDSSNRYDSGDPAHED